MKRIAIVIATTAGPVVVDRITPEPAPQSMVCLRRQSEVLPISPDYDDFVRPGSGVIMREFGPYEEGAFRLDVSGPIGTGKSWQLGVFAAHAVYRSKIWELSDLETADLIVWLTGTLDNDLQVGDVGHIAEKVEASAMVLAQYIAQGKQIVFGVSPQNAAFLQEHQPPQGIQVAPLKNADDLLQVLGLKRQKKDHNAFAFWMMAAVVVLAIGGLFAYQKMQVPQQVIIDVFSDRGQEPVYHLGEDLNLTVRLSRESWLACFYKQVDGQVIQVYPNDEILHVSSFPAEEDHVLADPQKGLFRIRLGPPSGEESVTCYATSQHVDAKQIPEDAPADTMRIHLRP